MSLSDYSFPARPQYSEIIHSTVCANGCIHCTFKACSEVYLSNAEQAIWLMFKIERKTFKEKMGNHLTQGVGGERRVGMDYHFA